MRTKTGRHAALACVLAFALGIAGCSGDDGTQGPAGAAGTAGSSGSNGVSCWDMNQNGVADLATEDLNKDGVVDVVDCRTPIGAYEVAALHRGYFTDNAYEGTQSCLDCHGKMADELMTTAHWKWEGVASNMTGFEGEIHGKNDVINNFCIAVPSNEGRCTQCHAGYGYTDANFDFANPKKIDCLACHDQTGTYRKAQTTAGLPDPTVDLQLVARSVGEDGGAPTRKACLFCHTHAGGDDNVKHGDLSSDLIATTREYDVHMGTDGANMKCVDCHAVKRDAAGKLVSHGIGGMPYHSTEEGAMKTCTDCHGSAASVHAGTSAEPVVNTHARLACQVCHIPAIARKVSTKVRWNWGDAGQDLSPVPVDPVTGRATYDKKKGSFVWANDVMPTLLYYDGKWDKVLINRNDRYTSLPAVLAKPSTDHTNASAMIYPFKKMVGNQPADRNNRTILVPHLFGTKGGPSPYWSKYDWNLALQEGAERAGQTYSGEYEFVETVMYLAVNHEIAPKETALGRCSDCHGVNRIDWQALGWTGDPVGDGQRPAAVRR